MRKFPDGFIFGADTAAYQAEGATTKDGRGPCYWDEYLPQQGMYSPEPASAFYERYKEDIKTCHDYGINGIRISIAWTRIVPDGDGEINPKGIAYYNDLIDTCIANGVEPFVTLHHFDTPLSLFKKGDWLSDEMVNAYVRFAKICFTYFGDRVKKWVTINEPWSLAAGQYIIGHFPPNIHYDLKKAAQAMHNMMVAHAKVVNLYKAMKLSGEIGIVHILEPKFAISEKAEDQKAARYEHIFCNRFLLDATIYGEYKEETLQIVNEILACHHAELMIHNEDLKELKQASKQLDFLGINYYQSHFMEHYDGESKIHHNGTGEKGSSFYAIKGCGKRVINPDIPTTDWDWLIYPQGLYHMLMELYQDYGFHKPIYITENGVGEKDELINETVEDDSRIDYIYQHLDAILDAVDQGVDVKGYFLWSLMDVFSWTNGYQKRYGLFYVDFKTQKRYAKKSARWYHRIATLKQLCK